MVAYIQYIGMTLNAPLLKIRQIEEEKDEENGKKKKYDILSRDGNFSSI